MQVANKTQLELEREKGPRFRSFVQVCVMFVYTEPTLARRNSPSSDRSSAPGVQALGKNWNESGDEKRRGWMGKKGSDAMGERKDGAQRKGGREKSGGGDGERRMERHETERTDGRMELNERRRSVGLKDEREGKATSPSPSRSSSSPL